LSERYPPSDCSTFEHEFTGNLEKWKVAAINEYQTNKKILEKGEVTIYTGPLQCFCDHQDKAGVKDGFIYNLKNIKGVDIVNAPICKVLNEDLDNITKLTFAVTIVIIVVNIILEMVVHNLVEWVGQDTISNQRAFTVKCLVVTEFFNTSIILLLVNGNLTEH